MIGNFFNNWYRVILLLVFSILPWPATAADDTCHIPDTISPTAIPVPAPEYLPVNPVLSNGSRARNDKNGTHELFLIEPECPVRIFSVATGKQPFLTNGYGGVFIRQIYEFAISYRAGPAMILTTGII